MDAQVTERDVVRWSRELDRVAERIGPRFGRRELRARAPAYLKDSSPTWSGRMAGSWRTSPVTPRPRTCSTSSVGAWDADAVRDDLVRYVAEHLGEPDGVLIVDETGFLKKALTVPASDACTRHGRPHRELSDRRVLCLRSAKGQTLVDRELYLPKDWIGDRPRCRVQHRGRGRVRHQTATRSADAHSHAEGRAAGSLVDADEVYGSDSRFRAFLQRQGLSYVVAISCQSHMYHQGLRTRVDEHAAAFGKRMWKRISCGAGTKGERFYEWAVVSWPAPAEDGSAKSDFTKSLLVRRSLKDPDEKAYYYTHAPSGTSLKTLVEIAGMRWAIEECFEQAKQLTARRVRSAEFDRLVPARDALDVRSRDAGGDSCNSRSLS